MTVREGPFQNITSVGWPSIDTEIAYVVFKTTSTIDTPPIIKDIEYGDTGSITLAGAHGDPVDDDFFDSDGLLFSSHQESDPARTPEYYDNWGYKWVWDRRRQVPGQYTVRIDFSTPTNRIAANVTCSTAGGFRSVIVTAYNAAHENIGTERAGPVLVSGDAYPLELIIE